MWVIQYVIVTSIHALNFYCHISTLAIIKSLYSFNEGLFPIGFYHRNKGAVQVITGTVHKRISQSLRIARFVLRRVTIGQSNIVVLGQRMQAEVDIVVLLQPA